MCIFFFFVLLDAAVVKVAMKSILTAKLTVVSTNKCCSSPVMI